MSMTEITTLSLNQHFQFEADEFPPFSFRIHERMFQGLHLANGQLSFDLCPVTNA
jgi:hypothetical protein